MSSEVEKAISGFSIIAEQVHIKEKTYEYINSFFDLSYRIMDDGDKTEFYKPCLSFEIIH